MSPLLSPPHPFPSILSSPSPPLPSSPLLSCPLPHLPLPLSPLSLADPGAGRGGGTPELLLPLSSQGQLQQQQWQWLGSSSLPVPGVGAGEGCRGRGSSTAAGRLSRGQQQVSQLDSPTPLLTGNTWGDGPRKKLKLLLLTPAAVGQEGLGSCCPPTLLPD